MTGYRNETAYGSGITNLFDIIVFEISELGNYDIIDYVLANYSSISSNAREFLNDIDTNSDEDTIEEAAEIIINELSDLTGTPLTVGLWLCKDVETVKELYGDDDIRAYPVSQVILSDLGSDGILYAYDTMPNEII